jgi:DNA processing protein
LDGLRPQPIPPKAGAEENATGAARAALTPDETKVFECFRGGAILAPDALTAATGLPVPTLSATLMMLELKRLIAKRADGAFEARSGNL